MHAPRRQLVCALHPLAVAAFLAANLAGTAGAQTTAGSPADATETSPAGATSTDQVLEPKALDSVTVSGARESASTRLQAHPA